MKTLNRKKKQVKKLNQKEMLLLRGGTENEGITLPIED